MGSKLYDQWPFFVGRYLCVVTPQDSFGGVFVGLHPLRSQLAAALGVEPPWALLRPCGNIEFIDPDNAAIAIYTSDGLIGLPPVTSGAPLTTQAAFRKLLRTNEAVLHRAHRGR